MSQPEYLNALKLDETNLNDLDEDLQSYFKLCSEKIGFIPNVLRSYSWNIKKLRAFTTFYNEIMLGESKLSKLEREMIATLVSSLNKCYYCQVSHGSTVRTYSKDPVLGELLIMDYRSAKLSDRHRSMLDFTSKLTKNSNLIKETDREELRKNDFSDDEIWDICEVVGFFNMTNRLASGISMMPNKEYHSQSR